MKTTLKYRCLTAIFALLPLSAALAECNGETWAPASRYQIKGSEAKDTDTGLTWKRCAEGMSWSGTTCTGEPSRMTWDAAMARYPQNGKSWRLPTKDELATLRAGELSKSGCWFPAINTRIFPGETQQISFWSSLAYAGGSGYAWSVGFYRGSVGSYNRDHDFAVRLVRAGQ